MSLWSDISGAPLHAYLSLLTFLPAWLRFTFLLGCEWKGEDRETGGAETTDAYFIKVLWTLQIAC